MEKIKTAKDSANFQLIALCAIDSYKTISEELDTSTMKIPKEVLLLDYVGFKVHALLAQQLVNWDMVTQTVNEGESQWKNIQGNVSDKSLYDTMETSIDGMQAAVKLRNVDMLRFASQITLDLVDLLEDYFIEKPKKLTKILPGKYIFPLISPRDILILGIYLPFPNDTNSIDAIFSDRDNSQILIWRGKEIRAENPDSCARENVNGIMLV